MNMASIDTNVLAEMIQAGVQITAYRLNKSSDWFGIIGTPNASTKMMDYWPLYSSLAEAPVYYDAVTGCYRMRVYQRDMYMLRFSNGWEWTHEKGLYDPKAAEQTEAKKLPAGEKYYKVFHCHGCQTCWEVDEKGGIIQHPHILHEEDVTEAIQELVKTSKELAAIAFKRI